MLLNWFMLLEKCYNTDRIYFMWLIEIDLSMSVLADNIG